MSEERLNLIKENVYTRCSIANITGIGMTAPDKEELELLEEIERLNNNINKGIEAINVYQNEKALSIGYQDLKRIRGILQGNEFDLQMFEEYLQELKGVDK